MTSTSVNSLDDRTRQRMQKIPLLKVWCWYELGVAAEQAPRRYLPSLPLYNPCELSIAFDMLLILPFARREGRLTGLVTAF